MTRVVEDRRADAIVLEILLAHVERIAALARTHKLLVQGLGGGDRVLGQLGERRARNIGFDVVRRKEREDRLAEARGVRGRALADRHVALGRVAGVDAVDVDDVAPAIDREMDAQARAQHQVAQVRPRLHRDAQRAGRRAAQLEHFETELIPARARVLFDVSGLHQSREEAMADADGQLNRSATSRSQSRDRRPPSSSRTLSPRSRVRRLSREGISSFSI